MDGGDRLLKCVCSLCMVQFVKYTCPRCNVQYCSLDCYKSEKHAQCAEDFYRESFLTELQSQTTSTAERSKMVEVLRRVGEDSVAGSSGEEEDDEVSLEERLAGVDLDAEDADTVWQRLTKSEQEQFHKAVSSGHLVSLLPVHTPWWKLIKPVIVMDEAVGADHHCIPDVLPSLPPLHTLVKGGKVSPMVRYNVLNVLYAYAYSVRLYNGDHHHLAVEAAQTVLDVSSCLADNVSFSMAGEALSHAVTTVQQAQHLVSSGEMVYSVLEDVSCILCSPAPPSRCSAPHALSDLHRMLTSATTQLHSHSGARKEWKAVQMASKKVYFLTVWASENVNDLQCLARLVDIEHEISVASRRTHSEQTRPQHHNKPSATNSTLITEIS